MIFNKYLKYIPLLGIVVIALCVGFVSVKADKNFFLYKVKGIAQNNYEGTAIINAGNKYEHVWFLQTRDLDFNSDSSYKNANSTSYGDYNGNGTVEPIKTELTTGSGFIPIGYSSDTTIRFKGSYDGQNHKLDNLYRKETTYQPALFNRVESSKITNLTLL